MTKEHAKCNLGKAVLEDHFYVMETLFFKEWIQKKEVPISGRRVGCPPLGQCTPPPPYGVSTSLAESGPACKTRERGIGEHLAAQNCESRITRTPESWCGNRQKFWETDFYTPPVPGGAALLPFSAPAVYKNKGP